MEAPNPVPTMGRVVWATFNASQIVGESLTVTRPAHVTVAHADGSVNAVANLDGPNDTPAEFQRYGAPPSTKWIGSLAYDPTGKKVPSWRWPPRS